MSKKITICMVVVWVLVSVGSALAGPRQASLAAANPNADPRFGLGVATRAGASSDAYGLTNVNHNDQDAISLLGLNPNAKTWAVFQPETNSDVNFILPSYNSYPQYPSYDGDLNDIPEGYTGANWNVVSSTSPGTPAVGTFIVTHIVLKDPNVNCQNPNDTTDTYCIYGLAGQPDAWGQDANQPGGKYLDAPTNFCGIPWFWRIDFKQPVGANCPDGKNGDPAYDPRGLISVKAKDIWSNYPNFGTGDNLIHDVRVPTTYWGSFADDTGIWRSAGGYIVFGGFYNPQDYKGTSYAPEGAFKRFIVANRNANPNRERIYAFLNFPDSTGSYSDRDPILPESYVWLFHELLVDSTNGIKALDPSAKFMVHLGPGTFPAAPTLKLSEPCPATPASFYPTQLVAQWHAKGYPGDLPVDYWGYTLYGGGLTTMPVTYANVSGNIGQEDFLQSWAKLAECRTKDLSAVSNGTQVTKLMLLEITTGVDDATFDDSGALRQGTATCNVNCSYAWEQGVHSGIGKWLKPLADAYPNLVYFSLQPTFNIPQYQWGIFVPATRQENAAAQVLSPTATGTAAGWSQAAQPGGSALYISDKTTVETIPNGKKITVSYFNDDGASTIGEAQLVINDVPDWLGYGTKATKYGIRVMYTPRAYNVFNANKMYVYTECAQGTTGCISGWSELANDGTWYTQNTLQYKTKIQVSSAGSKLTITYWIEILPGSPFYGRSNLNVFGFAAVDDPTKWDLSAGLKYRATQGSFYANFKRLGGIALP